MIALTKQLSGFWREKIIVHAVFDWIREKESPPLRSVKGTFTVRVGKSASVRSFIEIKKKH